MQIDIPSVYNITNKDTIRTYYTKLIYVNLK